MTRTKFILLISFFTISNFLYSQKIKFDVVFNDSSLYKYKVTHIHHLFSENNDTSAKQNLVYFYEFKKDNLTSKKNKQIINCKFIPKNKENFSDHLTEELPLAGQEISFQVALNKKGKFKKIVNEDDLYDKIQNYIKLIESNLPLKLQSQTKLFYRLKNNSFINLTEYRFKSFHKKIVNFFFLHELAVLNSQFGKKYNLTKTYLKKDISSKMYSSKNQKVQIETKLSRLSEFPELYLINQKSIGNYINDFKTFDNVKAGVDLKYEYNKFEQQFVKVKITKQNYFTRNLYDLNYTEYEFIELELLREN